MSLNFNALAVSTDDSNDPSVPIEGVASASADASKITTPVKGSGVSDSAASPLATATADMSATDISGALASATFPMVTATACAAAHDSEENLSDLPFQLQIKYVDMDGAQALRVITQAMPITRQREDAENGILLIVFSKYFLNCHGNSSDSVTKFYIRHGTYLIV